MLAEHGLSAPVSALRRSAMACVALPTCGLALAESERYLPDLITALETEVERCGLRDDEIIIRMTGCPNGCARPYLAEIGLVGTGPGAYNLYLGGAFDGTRLSKLHRKQIGHDEIVATLARRCSRLMRASGTPDERFSDFVIRAGDGARDHRRQPFPRRSRARPGAVTCTSIRSRACWWGSWSV